MKISYIKSIKISDNYVIRVSKNVPIEDAWHIVAIFQSGVGRVAPPPEFLLLEKPPLESLVVVVRDLVVSAFRGRRRREEPWPGRSLLRQVS